MPEPNLENAICYTLNCPCNECRRVDKGNTHHFIDVCNNNYEGCERRDLDSSYQQ